MKAWLILIAFVMVMGLVSATDVTYMKTGQAANFTKPCINNGTYCSPTATCNLTLSDGGNIPIINNAPMSNQISFYNYTIPGQNQGQYIASMACCDSGLCGFNTFPIEVNQLGAEINGAKTSLYIVVLAIAILFFIGVVVLGLIIPGDNKRDQMTGYILAVSNLKYLKYFMFAIAYLVLLLIVYFSWMISLLLNMDFLQNLFNFAFWTMTWLIIPLFILAVYFVITNAIRDTQVDKMLSGGFKVR